jgi:hypothetical protein
LKARTVLRKRPASTPSSRGAKASKLSAFSLVMRGMGILHAADERPLVENLPSKHAGLINRPCSRGAIRSASLCFGYHRKEN